MWQSISSAITSLSTPHFVDPSNLPPGGGLITNKRQPRVSATPTKPLGAAPQPAERHRSSRGVTTSSGPLRSRDPSNGKIRREPHRAACTGRKPTVGRLRTWRGAGSAQRAGLGLRDNSTHGSGAHSRPERSRPTLPPSPASSTEPRAEQAQAAAPPGGLPRRG